MDLESHSEGMRSCSSCGTANRATRKFAFAAGRSVSRAFAVGLIVLLLVWGDWAPAQSIKRADEGSMSRNSLCSVLESVAGSNALPLDFFIRLIWRESAFRPGVVGPVTRSGEQAQGIAQFMPATAIERGLLDPFNVKEALQKSGALLAELRNEFGNVGLAAAAYNAGPQRVRDFLAGSSDLPVETRSYVLAITRRPVEDWKTQALSAQNADLIDKGATMSCKDLVVSLEEQASPRTLVKAPHLSVPSWCYGLNHPNLSVCGSVHARGQSLTARSQVRRASRSLPLKTASFH